MMPGNPSKSPILPVACECSPGAMPPPSARTTGVVEAALAPKLANLLAARLSEVHPDIRSINTFIVSRMGAHHGLAATAWALKALGQTYPLKFRGGWQAVRTGATSRRFAIDAENILGIGFAFNDQKSAVRNQGLTGERKFFALTIPVG